MNASEKLLPSSASPSPSPSSTIVLTATWVVLLVFSLLNFYLADDVLSGAALSAGILASVFVKLGLVLAVFMELWHRGRAWLLPVLAVFGLVIGGLALVF